MKERLRLEPHEQASHDFRALRKRATESGDEKSRAKKSLCLSATSTSPVRYPLSSSLTLMPLSSPRPRRKTFGCTRSTYLPLHPAPPHFGESERGAVKTAGSNDGGTTGPICVQARNEIARDNSVSPRSVRTERSRRKNKQPPPPPRMQHVRARRFL
ncbi:hypothetical protein HPB50_022207 [Hyalomma asiaticum]|uniref:Uncharacterized protein n=1 Tax=Hyalomma asiaticum TaxID=266040 RepID=A0ACB7S7D1_HYAAI|nr:hypothetical protein HPB50_022207 [Hyalomma asiaticum]